MRFKHWHKKKPYFRRASQLIFLSSCQRLQIHTSQNSTLSLAGCSSALPVSVSREKKSLYSNRTLSNKLRPKKTYSRFYEKCFIILKLKSGLSLSEFEQSTSLCLVTHISIPSTIVSFLKHSICSSMQ